MDTYKSITQPTTQLFNQADDLYKQRSIQERMILLTVTFHMLIDLIQIYLYLILGIINTYMSNITK